MVLSRSQVPRPLQIRLRRTVVDGVQECQQHASDGRPLRGACRSDLEEADGWQSATTRNARLALCSTLSSNAARSGDTAGPAGFIVRIKRRQCGQAQYLRSALAHLAPTCSGQREGAHQLGRRGADRGTGWTRAPCGRHDVPRRRRRDLALHTVAPVGGGHASAGHASRSGGPRGEQTLCSLRGVHPAHRHLRGDEPCFHADERQLRCILFFHHRSSGRYPSLKLAHQGETTWI
jgi:hypothetical protein